MKYDDINQNEPDGQRDAVTSVPMSLSELPEDLQISHPMVLGACTMSQILKPFEEQLKAGDLAKDLAQALDHADLDGFADEDAMLIVQSRNLDALFNRMLIGSFNTNSDKFMSFMRVALLAQRQCQWTIQAVQRHQAYKRSAQFAEQTEGLEK